MARSNRLLQEGPPGGGVPPTQQQWQVSSLQRQFMVCRRTSMKEVMLGVWCRAVMGMKEAMQIQHEFSRTRKTLDLLCRLGLLNTIHRSLTHHPDNPRPVARLTMEERARVTRKKKASRRRNTNKSYDSHQKRFEVSANCSTLQPLEEASVSQGHMYLMPLLLTLRSCHLFYRQHHCDKIHHLSAVVVQA